MNIRRQGLKKGPGTGQVLFNSHSGAPGETRTPNLRIRSAALYPLSYGGAGRLYNGHHDAADLSTMIGRILIVTKPLVVHPLLFAIFPVLALLAQNLDWLHLSEGVRPLILSVLGGLGLLGLIWLAIRDLPRAGLLASLALLLFYSYGHLYGSLKGAGLGATIARHRYLAPAATALLVGVGLWILKVLRDPRPPTRVLNVVSAALLILPVVSIASYAVESGSPPPQELRKLSHPAGQNPPPDIYYIVVDAYARQDTLKEVFEFDNEPFLQGLENQGFAIARAARSNYAQTSLALAAALNLDYVEELVPEQNRGRQALWDLIKRSKVRSHLEALDYEIVAFSTGLEGTEWRDADIYMSPGTIDETLSLGGANPFESMLAQTTAMRLLIDGSVALPRLIPDLDYPYEAHRTRLRFTLDGLANLPEGEQPRLVFAHLILPHPPFVFDAEGNSVTPDAPFALDFPSSGSDEGYIRGYREQVRFLNRELEQIVMTILANADTTPVIVIQADHGPDSNTGRQGYVQERMTILNALLLPDGGDEIYPHLTPVNTFRLIFNHLFGGDYERLPDRAFYSEYAAPYEFIDVTGGVVAP